MRGMYARSFFYFIGNTVIHSCVKVEPSYEIKNMPERKFWAFFYCNLVQGGVILSYKWRKVVENGTKWWISS